MMLREMPVLISFPVSDKKAYFGVLTAIDYFSFQQNR
jgi:hypothetical protein